jgi:outer membrane protein assembly factor BamB
MALLSIACPWSPVEAAEASCSAQARAILEATGVRGGLVVHVGCGDGRLTAALWPSDSYLVQGLDTDERNVAKAREHLRSLGRYGTVSVRRFDGRRLPYVDNLVNLLVVSNPFSVEREEILRVLCPGGVAIATTTGRGPRTTGKLVKPWPAEIDQWPQYLHDADNNAVAHDTRVGPPRHLQWVDEPRWSRSHMGIPTVTSMVSASGRLLTIEDRATPENPFLPGRWRLIARDAFNGVVLWTHPFPDWEPITRYVKDIAVQLQRRLAAVGEVVYCTPGLTAPITAFDAATGKMTRTYKGTERTQEFAYHHGVLYAVIGDRMNAARYNIVKPEAWRGENLGGSDPEAPFGGTGFRGAYAPQSPDKPDPVCKIVAVEADSGEELWRKEDVHGYTGCSLAVRGKHAAYQTAGGLFCVNPRTGEGIWSVEKPIQSGDGTAANTVILSDTMVYAQEGKSFYAYALEDGSQKWEAPIANNYEKVADLFLAAGAVWTGGSKQPTSYDPETGEKLTTIPQRMTGPMGHDRCYRNFITDRFYINSKTGGADFLDLQSQEEFPNHWLRGTCGMGVLPCNGLLYVPPYSCQCSVGAMIQNMNALYTEKGIERSNHQIRVEKTVRLVEGPAYGQTEHRRPSTERPAPWPTYRHDGTRGGATQTAAPAELTPRWETQLNTTPSAPVVADGKVFVADVDAHTLYALDAADGSVAWHYVAGSRVDSPPTFHNGLLLFGSRDGWVHCLRASDGALVWKFKDLPDKLIGAFGQLESAWPVCGSVLVVNDVAYFAAGRSSFLDGGIFLYGLEPETGHVVHRRQVYGPFDEETGFPATGNAGSKSDILVTDGSLLYMRHKAFKADLSDALPSAADANAPPNGGPKPHVIASAGFLDHTPQHRTYWTISTGFVGKTTVRGPSGDILVTNGKDFYEVRGFPVHRHSYFDPRLTGYRLLAGTLRPSGESQTEAADNEKRRRRRVAAPKPQGRWTQDLPLTGQAMVLADDVILIAGTPAFFPPDHPVEKYHAGYAGKLGGVLWAASAANGKKLAVHKLDAAPCWDGMAAADGSVFVSLTDGTVQCWRSDKRIE